MAVRQQLLSNSSIFIVSRDWVDGGYSHVVGAYNDTISQIWMRLQRVGSPQGNVFIRIWEGGVKKFEIDLGLATGLPAVPTWLGGAITPTLVNGSLTITLWQQPNNLIGGGIGVLCYFQAADVKPGEYMSYASLWPGYADPGLVTAPYAGGGYDMAYSINLDPGLVPPTLATNPATSVSLSSATLNGTLTDDGKQASDCGFEYGLTTAYGNITPTQNRTKGQTFTQNITGLLPNSKYHFRAIGSNPSGAGTPGSDAIFYTTVRTVVAPTITTNPATGLQAHQMTLNAILNDDGGESCNCHFEWGTTPAYGNTTVNVVKTAGQTLSATITGLISGQVYHFRAVASNIGGTTAILLPNKQGDQTEILPGGASNWPLVSDGSDATFVYTIPGLAVDQHDLYGLPFPPGDINTVTSVIVTSRGAKTAGASSSIISTYLKTHGVSYLGINNFVNSNIFDWITVYALNPNTGLAWTVAELNVVQSGVRLGAPGGASSYVYCTEAHLTINYNPVSFTTNGADANARALIKLIVRTDPASDVS